MVSCRNHTGCCCCVCNDIYADSASYNDVDRVLQTLVCPASPENDRVQDALTVEIGPEIIDKIIKRRSNSRFKREKSPIYISRERYE